MGKYLRHMKKGLRKRISVYRRDLWDSKQYRSKKFANKMKIEYDGRKPRKDPKQPYAVKREV